jgi:hypothetical protein
VTTTRFARSEKACCPQVQRHHSKACTADASVRECCCWLTRSPAFSQQRERALAGMTDGPGSHGVPGSSWRGSPRPPDPESSRRVVFPFRGAGDAIGTADSLPPQPRAWPWRDVRSRPHSARSLPARDAAVMRDRDQVFETETCVSIYLFFSLYTFSVSFYLLLWETC